MKKTNIIKLPVKEKEMKWWDVECVLTQEFTIGIYAEDEKDAIECAQIEYDNGSIQPHKECPEEEFKIERALLMEDQDRPVIEDKDQD